MKISVLFVVTGMLWFAGAQPSVAADRVLTIGGGYSPSGNQVSLEKNILFFKRVLQSLGLGSAPHTILFADGQDAARDLQFADSSKAVPEIHRLLAEVLGSTKGLNHEYRSSRIEGVRAPARVEQIDRVFNEWAGKFQGGDRLLLYFTGHGGKTIKKGTQNTKMYLWNGQSLPVSDLVKRLDKVSPKVPVILVMVQCYSGGFANVIFKEGDPKKGLATHARAGFFATVHDRVAAGCTPDINEANYEEYSTYFWAAIHGRTRLGQAIQRPDHNGDGRVSFAEAHSYALLESETIDISIKTSDAFLRQFSRIKKQKDDPVQDLVTPEVPFAKLLAHAGPNETAVLQGLSRELKLSGESRVAAARKLLDNLAKERKALGSKKGKERANKSKYRKELANRVKSRWPELANPWHPQVARILREDGDRIVRSIRGHHAYSHYRKAADAERKIGEQDRAIERRWVKVRRLLYTAEGVALAANLPQVADDKIQQRYAELIALEDGFLKQPTSVSTTRPALN
ncbi:MAG: hypothetical protein OER86_12675 [Phycisphaerae bacterium]|nr:hypothetical protein [Phycisphaerae bacterium]